MKVVIIGYGGVGSTLAKLLSEENEIEKIICGDIKFSSKSRNKKIVLKKINVLKKPEFLSFLKQNKPNVVVNTSLPGFNTTIMETCLEAGVNYVDTCSFWDYEKNPRAKVPYHMEQLDYDSKFKKRGITGLINAGVSPGLTNLVAKECADKLDEIDSVKIRLLEDTGSRELFFSWNKDWLLNEIGAKPLVYQDGKFKMEEPFLGEEEFEFPKPIGKKKVYYFCQDEVGSLPFYIKTKNLDVKGFDNNIDISKLLLKLGLLSDENIKVKNFEISPVEFLSAVLPDSPPGTEKKFKDSIFAISVIVEGKDRGQKKSVRYYVVFPRQKEIEEQGLPGNFITYPTALSLKLFLMALPEIKQTGVFPPEAIESGIRRGILDKLENYPLKIFK